MVTVFIAATVYQFVFRIVTFYLFFRNHFKPSLRILSDVVEKTSTRRRSRIACVVVEKITTRRREGGVVEKK